MLHDIVVGTGPPIPLTGDTSIRDMAARPSGPGRSIAGRKRIYKGHCPTFIRVAEMVNPRLNPEGRHAGVGWWRLALRE